MTKIEGRYKEYKYQETNGLIRIDLPSYQKGKLKSLKGLSCFPMHTFYVYEAQNCIQIQPWMLFQNCTSLTEVQFPSKEPIPLLSSTTDSIKEKIDVIDLYLKPEGFYR